MKGFLTKLFYLFVLVSLTTSCASRDSYWIPPSSSSTRPPAIAFLSTTDVASLDPSPTPVQLLPTLDPVLTAKPVEITPTGTAFVSLPALLDPPPTDDASSGLPTLLAPTMTPEVYVANSAPILYYAQAADTLRVVAVRFGVLPAEISSPETISQSGFINPGQLLIIPRRLANTTSSQHLLPDSEVVFSPSAVSFDVPAFVNQAGGYLKTFQEWHKSTGMKSGAEIIMRVAIENSINPRLLLSLLEYRSHWVYGRPEGQAQIDYPLGHVDPNGKGLYNQLTWAVNQLSIGYYAYREGRMTEIQLADGVKTRLSPDLNAGTAALQYFFAQIYGSQDWLSSLSLENGFPAMHVKMFGDPWQRAQTVEPLYPPGVSQPPLILPFTRNWTWAFTGGPHGAWEHEGAYAALDFAPGSTESGCVDTPAWAVASASGLVVRTGPGLVVLDLDGDGHEQTGWVLVYLHVATKDRIAVGTWVAAGDPLGHPSCEGGVSTGTHLHIARKFNGEWVPADGPLPFNLGGWVAHYSGQVYKGTLTRDGATVTACVCSNAPSFVTRTDADP